MTRTDSQPWTHDEIKAALRDAQRQVDAAFGGFELCELYRHKPGKWAPIDDLRHLSRSVSPLVRALDLPKIALRVLFGRSKKKSMTYDQVLQLYYRALDAGAVANGRFIPSERREEGSEAYREAALRRWNNLGDALLQALDGWRDEQLDKLRLPHPVLGKITVREMLFFTHLHNLKHIDIARRRARETAP